MKATTKRLVDRHFEVKGTADYNEQKVETYSKTNNKWIFLGWSIPIGLVYSVVGTNAGIFLEEKNTTGEYRYKLHASNMAYIDFED
jgi:hypothetical protein